MVNGRTKRRDRDLCLIAQEMSGLMTDLMTGLLHH